MITRLPPQLEAGRPAPMGAFARDGGVNFVAFSDHALRIELCVFDASGARELRRYALHGPHDGLFHGFLPGLGLGLVYGLRAHGPFDPEAGHRFNPHKLLLDPWGREIIGTHHPRAEHSGHTVGHPLGHRSFDTRDNAAWALKSRVAAPPAVAPGWLNAPRIPMSERVLYELHVKGFSRQLPGLPEELRGTYAGLAHPAAIAHFKALGVTTLSLLPVHQHLDEPGLAERGVVNHWGYNTIGFFSPDPVLASRRADPTEVAEEFRHMVAALHEQGLEVLLDVVYNHTAEGGETGTTLCWRGLDHASWYRLVPEDKSRCDNTSGCGNTVNVAHPRVTQWVLDSLRYWALEMGVDGFRFDLAPVLGRTNHGYDARAAFFTALRQDPVLAQVLLVAEPWDGGHGGYQVGRFPGNFAEWNDQFRDSVRRYWLNQPDAPRVGRGEFARRFSASSDLFHHGQRRPSASVNFIVAHDGFTLADLVSHRRKHNLANGEGNRDGRDGEPCADFGAEGPTHDDLVRATRGRVQRALLATLALAQGTPMLCAGDEIGRTQGGNNNAWCQDNATSWLDWPHADRALLEFAAQCLALRRHEPALRHDEWFAPDAGAHRLRWLSPLGGDMQVDDWHHGANGAFACWLRAAPAEPALTESVASAPTTAAASAPPTAAASAPPTAAASAPRAALMLCFNPEPLDIAFALPPGEWQVALDSSGELPVQPPPRARGGITVPQRCLLVLRGGEPVVAALAA